MKDCKFKKFIIDVYNEWNKEDRIFTKRQFGTDLRFKNFFGTLFGAISRHTFENIKDIIDYMDALNPNMIMLVSRKTEQEIEVYEHQLLDYKIDGDILTIQLKNKEVKFEM